ncbi:hypothetical protein [Natronococcus wangiae]|uniref:hypothetical protein n=1 Tax=Natronococcus wangiae TaxID=3068275 RepID=UPI003133C6C7
MQSSRRALLASVGSGTVLLSGCSRFSSAQSREAPEPDELPESGVDELPGSEQPRPRRERRVVEFRL